MAVGMFIIDGKVLLCHGISEESVDKKVLTIDYNNRTVFDFFSDTFTDDFGSPDLNIPPITIGNRSCPHKRACYIPDLLLAAISVVSENYVSNLNTPADSPDFLPSDDPNPIHAMNKDEPYHGRLG